ncbi:hypothetical protein [Mucilaginibacter flavidus]|uniref:hypothetical protein n=1 Tax=Mucilaginibacter flavidus TaxID=2949309 RepID=UPI0020931186|nr:hypothetical protein [Mucilaginibacter flavidus]MCO5946599.1 hypothetical protein [Mucilaginibacter flavidus]
MSQINIKHFANLNNECLRGLEFYQHELGFMEKRLEEIATDNTGKEVAEEIEHFQNNFIIHRNYITELKHLLHVNDKTMERQLLGTGVFVTEDTANEHQEIYKDYLTEEKLFNDLRHEFNRFAAKWM